MGCYLQLLMMRLFSAFFIPMQLIVSNSSSLLISAMTLLGFLTVNDKHGIWRDICCDFLDKKKLKNRKNENVISLQYKWYLNQILG